jgi:hypothetical protein
MQENQEEHDGRKGMGSHQSAKMMKDEWLTPPHILEKLGPFDLDPCSPIQRPWPTAKTHFTIEDDGLSKKWIGRVWCNPPYGLIAASWLNKLAEHGNGIALIFARTETKMFFEQVWKKAYGLLFLEGRLYFHHVSGEVASANAGAPSVLVAYGKENFETLKTCGISGQIVPLNISKDKECLHYWYWGWLGRPLILCEKCNRDVEDLYDKRDFNYKMHTCVDGHIVPKLYSCNENDGSYINNLLNI